MIVSTYAGRRRRLPRSLAHVLVLVPALVLVAAASLPVAATAAEPAAPTATSPSHVPPGEADPPAAVEPAATEPIPTEPTPTEPAPPDPTTATEPAPTEPDSSTAPTPEESADPDPGTDPPPGSSSQVVPVADPDATPDPIAAASRRAPEPKVTICHRTNSRTNPYNQVVVTEASILDAHQFHTGPVFSPDVDDWGDIIPPVRPGLPDGLNWPEGRDVLDNGCEVPPDVGPLPEAVIGTVTCAGPDASIVVTLANRPAATAPAFFRILVNGTVARSVGPVSPGESREVVLRGPVDALEDETFTITVRSGGEVVATRVVTVDCVPNEPAVEIGARLACVDGAAQGTATVTNNGQAPVVVSAEVDGVPVGTPVTVPAGTTATGTVDLAPYEDRTVDVDILVDGAVVASYTVTPDCVAPQAQPRVSVAGSVCPPPSTTVTLANTGDPDSKVVFSIWIDGRLVQVSAPIYGGDTTTIVGDLTRFEDQTVSVVLRANGEVLGRRAVSVDCQADAAPAAAGRAPARATAPEDAASAAATLPSVGSAVDRGTVLLGLGLVALGSLLLLGHGRRGGRAP